MILAVFLGLAVLLAVALMVRRAGPLFPKSALNSKFKGQIIEDSLVIPDTRKITASDGELIPRGAYNVKLRPQAEEEEVFIPKALLTLKQSYELTRPEAEQWASDVNLILVRSIGALNLDGQASAWQVVYGSKRKARGYEIIVQGDQVVSRKEVETKITGYDLPNNWYDSNEAIISLQNLAQFGHETVSSISFYYSLAARLWAYGLATGSAQETTSMWVK